MIMVDANILLYAEDSRSPLHDEARRWWDAQLSGTAPVYLAWMVINAFIRIGTNPRVFERPLSIDEAVARVDGWLKQPPVRPAIPTARHWELLSQLLREGKATANLVADAHLAAVAIEYGCALFSTDADFSRFPGLQWKNPLEQGGISTDTVG